MVWNYYFISARWLPPLRINKVKVKVKIYWQNQTFVNSPLKAKDTQKVRCLTKSRSWVTHQKSVNSSDVIKTSFIYLFFELIINLIKYC